MAKAKEFSKARCKTIDISRYMNFPGRRLQGEFWGNLAKFARSFPTGDQKPWGIPFKMATESAKARAIVLRKGESVTVPVGARADYVCVLHTFRKADTDKTSYVEAQPVGRYELRYASGPSHEHAIRARLDVPIPESPGPAQMAMPFHMPETLDPTVRMSDADAAGMPERLQRWGWQQYAVKGGGGEPMVFAIRNPNPGKMIKELVMEGSAESPLIVAGVTAYRGTDHPLRHLARRMYRVRTRGKGAAKAAKVEVDMGSVARTDETLGPRGKRWLSTPYGGLNYEQEPARDGEKVYSIYGARDATVSVGLEGRKKAVELSLGEAYETGESKRGIVRLERLGGKKQWMEVEIVDGSSGKPTPVRIHISGAAGEYIAPYGHHEQINANWFEDYGADLKEANRSYAYVPGTFTTDLPTGELYIEMLKGFEYAPTRCKVTVKPGQRKLRLRINRWADLRSKGWVTADTHVHFLSPQTAWLEAQCEGLNVLNLLASQWGRLFTNVGDISGRVGVVENDTVVWVGTENRNHMLGHISMLGTKGLPVFPMCAGGVYEAWVGDPDFRTLTEWAQECKEKDGVVIRPHFPYCGFTEDPVLAVMGVVDALEIYPAGARSSFPLQEWYGYLNNGYRVAVAGGTDKMNAATAVGHLRTYALLDRNRGFTYENWARAMRAGRTFSTSGPLISMEVEGKRIGDTIRLPSTGGKVEVNAEAESAWPIGRIEVVQNGRVVASESSRKGAKKLSVSAKLSVTRSGWIAARCSGVGGKPTARKAAHTSPVYVTCGAERPYDGPALQHMLNLTQGGIEYLETLSTRFSDRDQERMIRLYRKVERHLIRRLRQGGRRRG